MKMKTLIFGTILFLGCFDVAISEPSPGRSAPIALAPEEHLFVQTGKDNERIFFDQAIPKQEREALRKFIRKEKRLLTARVVLVSKGPALYLVSAYEEGQSTSSEKDFGKRLFLFEKDEKGYKQLARTRGAADSYLLNPMIFAGGGKKLVLAEIGTEYPWGMLVYEIRERDLVHLGSLDVAAIVEDGELACAIPYAEILLDNKQWIVKFHTDLELNPGGKDQKQIKRAGEKPVIFKHQGKGFKLED